VQDQKYHLDRILVGPVEPNNEVLLVSIDEASINHIGRWPWSRAQMSQLLASMKDASVIVLDMVFSEPSAGDDVLAQQL